MARKDRMYGPTLERAGGAGGDMPVGRAGPDFGSGRASTPMGPRLDPAVLSQSRSTLGSLTGARNPSALGARFSTTFKKGGKVKKMAKGGSTASKRADGCATKGKTKGRFV